MHLTKAQMAVLVFAALYWLSPLDVIPFLPFDDIAVALLAFSSASVFGLFNRGMITDEMDRASSTPAGQRMKSNYQQGDTRIPAWPRKRHGATCGLSNQRYNGTLNTAHLMAWRASLRSQYAG